MSGNSNPEWPSALAHGWHPIAYAHEVTGEPRGVALLGRPLVVFRTDQGFSVLEDRCPHRNVPLSAGRVASGRISCPYHGWTFSGDGRCVNVPGSNQCPAVAVPSYPAVERHGLIWTTLAETPPPFPTLPSELADTQQHHFWWPVPAQEGHILDAIENLLDPMHSYFLHPGLVRASMQPRLTDVLFTQGPEGCVARFSERHQKLTLLQRMTERGRAYSYCRYIAPTITQVAFEDDRGIHFTVTAIFSPEDHDRARPYVHFVTRKGWLPAWLKRRAIILFNTKILEQDGAMVAMQNRNTKRFGGPDYHQGEIDCFGPVIWALVNGRTVEPTERQFQITP